MGNYGLYKKGTGGNIRKIKGNPRSPKNLRDVIVWDNSKKGVKSWIKTYGTKTQKTKHLK